MYGLGACPTPSDIGYPSGCPSGFSLVEQYYIPNSATGIVPQGTPGAVPMPNPTSAAGCPLYVCQNPQGQTPGLIQGQQMRAQCNSAQSTPWLIGGLAAFILLPGWSKLLGAVGLYRAVAGGISCSGGL